MTNNIIPKFNNYVCEGDDISWEIDGFTITAKIIFDEYIKPNDKVYSDEQIKRWRNDDWFFCGIELTVAVKDVPIPVNNVSLWGLQANLVDNNDYLSEVAFDLGNEALTNARTEVLRMRKVLNEVCA